MKQQRHWLLPCLLLVLPLLYFASVYGLAYATGRNWVSEQTSLRVARIIHAPLRWYIHSSEFPGGRHLSNSIQTIYLQGKEQLIAERRAFPGTSR